MKSDNPTMSAPAEVLLRLLWRRWPEKEADAIGGLDQEASFALGLNVGGVHHGG
jgi:hypothetical protein